MKRVGVMNNLLMFTWLPACLAGFSHIFCFQYITVNEICLKWKRSIRSAGKEQGMSWKLQLWDVRGRSVTFEAGTEPAVRVKGKHRFHVSLCELISDTITGGHSTFHLTLMWSFWRFCYCLSAIVKGHMILCCEKEDIWSEQSKGFYISGCAKLFG